MNSIKTKAIKPKGRVEIVIGGNLVYQGNNSNGADAAEITLKALVNSNEYLASIAVMQDEVTIAVATITSIEGPAFGTVTVVAEWEAGDFSGAFNKLALRSISGKEYAIKEELELEKTSSQTMAVSWILTTL